MNYRQLQHTCKALSRKYGISFNCRLNATKSILQATLDSLINLGYITDSMLLDCGYYDSSAKQEELVTDSATVETACDIKSEVKTTPFNAHVEMWSLLARASEILTGIVTLDHPEDYRGEIQNFSSKLGKFIYFCVRYSFHQWQNDKIIDDLETCKQLQTTGDYAMARNYLINHWKPFYVPALSLYHSPYLLQCSKIVSSLT